MRLLKYLHTVNVLAFEVLCYIFQKIMSQNRKKQITVENFDYTYVNTCLRRNASTQKYKRLMYLPTDRYICVPLSVVDNN